MKVKELPKDVVLKIAAGEVVTGCFSVVKELVENAIDAHAKKIEVEIEAGGKEFIRVSDDGDGMSVLDLKEAIKPHTTSKIDTVEDLHRLTTYGFRGEALSTIASVSRMVIASKLHNDESGAKLKISGGLITSEEPYYGNGGTTVEVFDLLFNTPARRKFLKSAAVEGRMVTEIIQRFILSNPNITFSYIRDGKTTYDVPGTLSLKERIKLIFPEISTEDLIEISHFDENSGIAVKGFITMPEKTRLNRFGEMIFVNNRYVKQFELNYALERGYGETLEKGRFPFAVVFINIEPGSVDVNIHPQKLEVKFSETSRVLEIVKRTVRKAIHEQGTYKIKIKPISPEAFHAGETSSTKPIERQGTTEKSFNYRPLIDYRADLKKVNQGNSLPMEIQRQHFRTFGESFEKTGNLNFIGVFGERYILVESDKGLLIIDQHAAHERLLFEKLKDFRRIEAQQLLSPLELKLDDLRYKLLDRNKEKMTQLGFHWKSKNDTIILETIPASVPQSEAKKVFMDILDELRLEKLEEPEKLFDNLLASIACRAALKTGDRLSIEEARRLVDELKEKKLIACPHGRPISMLISLSDLDNYFSRR
ncbi:DNA mismatch repair protein MutL [Kosmotoga arenicorallina S304]|uniref:DNA mismatch repair protein MutL n=1 Tax=Kosmotoga arenicorallina S304 TaxID=1453497 RepID=A0A182C717_9BACT|nr:DNA mismatch repair endonuclease MutL [Kosmotoga arenicorallina]OAA31259.1 DNA mismatch repair protein MutL [Kosmotoga arenicorallina S304]